MAYKPLRMDKIKRIYELHRKGVPKKKIARLVGVSKNTVKKYLTRITELGSNDENVIINSNELRYQPGRHEAHRDEILLKMMP